MSFTDEENKLIEEEENKAEEEIKAKFQSFFSKEEIEDSAREFKQADKPEEPKTPAKPSETETVARSKEPARKSVAKKNGNSKPKTKRPRISGPDYALSGQKIINDSNYRSEKSRRAPERKALPASYKVSDKLYVFGQDSLPNASNELTRSARINSTSKVRRREKQLLKADSKGRKETSKKAQVSVFSAENRTDKYSTSYSYHSAQEVNRIIASGKVSQDTARLSRDAVDRVLNDTALKREARERQAALERAKGRSTGRRRTSSRRYDADTEHSRIKSVDNSKKTIRARERANKRVKQSSPAKVIINLIVLALIIGICIFGYNMAKMVFDDAPMDADDVTKIEFTVDENTTDDIVADFLVKNKMVENETIYKARAKIFDAEYVPGTYELSPSYSTEKIINILSGFDYSSGS